MNRRFLPRSPAWAALGLLCAQVAGATALVREDVAHLSETSDVIVRGTVRRVESRWTSDHRRIVTDVELQVAESLKGAPGQTLVVMQPGGVVGDIGQKVSGLASFAQGEEVVVFLQQRGTDRFIVSGMAQGKFRVERSSDGTSAFAVPDSLGDAVVVDAKSGQPTAERTPILALEELRRTVRAALAPSRKGGAQ